VQRLQTLYDTHPDSSALERGRVDAAGWARSELQGPVAARLRTLTVGRVPERPVNNARLIGARIYRTRLDLFDRWFEQHGRDVRASVAAMGTLMKGVEGDSAYVRLEAAVGDSAGSPR
jgi:putative aminopeptidase